jgi:predicted phosphodiesterase
MNEKFLNTSAVAKILGVGTDRVAKYVRDGKLTPATRTMGTYRNGMGFHPEDIERFRQERAEVERGHVTPLRATKSEKQEAYEAGLSKGLEETFGKLLDDHVRKPDWSVEGSLPKSSPGTPVLFLSDLHAGEVVEPEQVNGKNAYGWELLEKRLETVVSTMVELLTVHLAKPDYDGLVVVLGGDMVSGDIHEELKETNEYRDLADGKIKHATSVIQITRPLAAVIVGHLLKLADIFGHVYIVGTPGNHGRLDKKPRAKGYVATNADYHTYMLIQDRLSHDPRFTFNFPLSRDVRFDVAGRRFLLTHGDQFRGGDGMIGPIGPIMRGDVKKRQNAMLGLADEQMYDTLLCGHFHTTIMLPSLVVNGSLKGLDEYAAGINVRQERPAQMLFTVHPKHGITWYLPINARPYL